MSLSGNLGFVSLDEVLRLITRSKQSGAVDVKGDRIHGRIYVGRTGVSLATTYSNDTLRRHLTKSGLLTADQVREIAAGTSSIAVQPEADRVNALLREMSVEGIHQMGLHGTSFEVFQEESTPFASPDGFDLEDLLSDARKRMSEWEEVRAIVSDLDREIRLQRDLGDRLQVTIDKDAWRVVSQMGHGASIRDLSDQLGTTEFWTARVTAGLVEDDLMTIQAAETVVESYEETPVFDEPAEPEASFEEASAEPVAEFHEETHHEDEPAYSEFGADEATVESTTEDDVYEETFTEVEESVSEAEPVFAEEEAVVAADTDADEGVDPNESWWKEPETESSEDDAVFAAADGTAMDEVEEDTETFLEKVFSELEPSGEAEEGYGLLRRRRMGAIRDNSSS